MSDPAAVGPDVPPSNSAAAKAEIAAAGAQLPAKGGAEELEGMPPPAMPAGAAGPPGEVSPELAASLQQAQTDSKDAVAKSEGDATAYKAEMSAQRDRFDNEQHATMLEQLKTMTPVQKRQQLQDMGYDPKAVKQMSDADLDRVIEDKMDTEARKTRILGMDPDELKALTPGRKIQYLVDLGIDRGDLDKVGQAKATKLFDDVMAVAHVPGKHEVKIKISSGFLGLTGKSWVVSVNCDAEGNTDIQAKSEGGFLSKLWGWVKLALPIILTVLAPLTAGASLIVLAIYQAATAIKSGDWLGAVIGVAGALVGVGAVMAARGALSTMSATFSKIASVAGKVKAVAQAAQAAMLAAKAKNAGSLLGALSAGAALFAKFSAESAERFSTTMQNWSDRLKKWGDVISGGQKVAAGIKGGDPIAAIGGAFDTVAATIAKPQKDGEPQQQSGTVQNLQRAANVTNYVDAGRRAVTSTPPNYGFVAEAALGLAGVLKQDRKLEDAARLTAAATRLKAAWDNRDKDPGGLAAAAFDVASAVQIARYDATNPEDKDADGKPVVDTSRDALITKYQHTGQIVRSAGQLLTAATAKPRPNYIQGLDAATQLIADLTTNKQLDAAAVITQRLDAWTAAISSKNEQAIIAAGSALGEAINGLRKPIDDARAQAKQDAEKALAPGETLPDDDAGEIPPLPSRDIVPPVADTMPAIPPSDGVAVAQDPDELLHFTDSVTVKPEPPHFTDSVTVKPEGEQETEPEKETEKESERETEKETEKEAFSPEVTAILHAIEAMSEYKKWDNPLAKAGLNEIVKIADLVEALHNEGKTTGEEYRKAEAALLALKQSSKLLSILLAQMQKWAPLASQLRPSRDVVMQFTEFAKFAGGMARLAGIPDKVFQFCDDAAVAWGYKPDGSDASITERAAAAGRMALIAASLPAELRWAGTLAETAIRKYGTMAVVDALEFIKSSSSKLGSAAVDVIVKWTEPILEKIGEREGGQIAMAAARRVGTAIAEWAGKEAVAEVLAESASSLAVNMGLAFRIAVAPEFVVAYEIAKLEANFAAELYKSAHQSISVWLSTRLFGKQVTTLKNEIRSKANAPHGPQADTFFRYAFNNMLTGDPKVTNTWQATARDKLGRKMIAGPSFSSLLPSNPVEALLELPEDVKTIIAAPALRDIALDFVNEQYKQVFGEDPP